MSEPKSQKPNTPDISESDRERLIRTLRNLREGDFSPVDTSLFEDTELATELSDMVTDVARRNTTFLVRLNDAMTRIGNAGCLKAILDQVEKQQRSVSQLMVIKDRLHLSVRMLEDFGLEMLALSRQIRNSCEPCVEDMENSHEDVEHLTALVRETVEDISLSLLTMDVELPEDTYVQIDSFIDMMRSCTDALSNRKAIIEDTAEIMAGIHGRMQALIDDVVGINNIISEQNEQSTGILKGVEALSDSANNLSISCYKEGEQLYRISRDVDNARNDMFRHNSRPTIHDELRVYEVDHMTLAWRMYNHVMDIETLKITQVNNVDRCKFGLWAAKEKEPFVMESLAHRHAVAAHALLHKHAIECFRAKEDSNLPLANKEAALTLDAFEEFRLALEELHALYIKNGIMDDTPMWKFRK